VLTRHELSGRSRQRSICINDGVDNRPKADEPVHVLAAAIRAAEILGMLLDDEDVPLFGGQRDELAALLPLLGVDHFDAEPGPGSTRRDRDQSGTKVTVQVVLHADDDSETVAREVFTLTLTREALAPDTVGLQLQEAKDLLTAVQDTVVEHQVSTALSAQIRWADDGSGTASPGGQIPGMRPSRR